MGESGSSGTPDRIHTREIAGLAQSGQICTLKAMKPEITTLEPRTVLAIANIGPYSGLRGAYTRLMGYCAERNLLGPSMTMMTLAFDDPRETPEDKIRSCACVDPGVQHLPEDGSEVELVKVAGGRYAIFLHEGSYEGLPEAYRRICDEWLPSSGERRAGPFCEIYLNNPATTPEPELRTQICMPLA